MPKAEKNDKLATDRSDNSGGGTARAMNAVASAAKAQSTKGSHSARSAKLSKKSSKGISLAVSKIGTLAEENDFAMDGTRVAALEQQLEIQRSQFEQQMQQSAMAMEELFDQLAGMRKEKDMALVALQKALAAQHAISVAGAPGAAAAASSEVLTEVDALNSVRLQGQKDANEQLELEVAHLSAECDRLRNENTRLQAVMSTIKQLVLSDPIALNSRGIGSPVSWPLTATKPESTEPARRLTEEVVAEAVMEKPIAAAVAAPPATAATSSPTATATATAASLAFLGFVAEAPAVPMVTEAAVGATSAVGTSIAEAGASTSNPVATAATVEVPPAEVPCMHTHAHIHTHIHAYTHSYASRAAGA